MSDQAGCDNDRLDSIIVWCLTRDKTSVFINMGGGIFPRSTLPCWFSIALELPFHLIDEKMAAQILFRIIGLGSKIRLC